MAYKKVDPKSDFPKMEEEILAYWDANDIFKKSVEKAAPKGDFVFFDGPPFATGTPHYGHIVASAIKDAVPRYFTMRGYRVERKWGWDCHGLPIENIAEKELGIRHKKEIEELGVAKFNDICRSKVLEYAEDWKKVMHRFGRWADMENAYKTMDRDYMESVWWVFKELWDKGLVYEDYRSMHICPRCETTLSQQEVSEGYKDVKDLSVIAKFELVDTPTPHPAEPGSSPQAGEQGTKTYVLAWTTTPWTLPGNVALAVGEDIEYVKVKDMWIPADKENIKPLEDLKNPDAVKIKEEYCILAKETFENHKHKFHNSDPKIVETFTGSELVGKSYKPLFDYYAKDETLENHANGWKIYAADFVTTEDGTGVVHIAPAFGEDDMALGKKESLPFIQHVGMDGIMKDEVTDLAGKSVSPRAKGKPEEIREIDLDVIRLLKQNGTLFSSEKFPHSYPHCWRCDTPLLNYATSSWFIRVTELKDRAIALAKDIHWSPEHVKAGRFGKWLAGARDWSISRQRYWASVMPIWKCDCGEMRVFGSVDELRKNADQKISKVLFVRHGESENNVNDILSDSVAIWPLTEKGRADIEMVCGNLKDKIDVIFASPVLRTKETAELINRKTRVEILEHALIREISCGEWNNKTVSERGQGYEEYRKVTKYDPDKRFAYAFGSTGESRQEVMERTVEFIKEISSGTYAGKTVLVVGHAVTYETLKMYAEKLSAKEYFENYHHSRGRNSIDTFYFGEDGKPFDLHKDNVDGITCECEKCGGVMRRIPDVLDTWFDSGSMPYAQAHYPFEGKESFDSRFPADFIAEGIDQTRAWFYYLHVMATGLRDNIAYKNVIVNGIVLAEDGLKMSKKLKNYPDPMQVLEKHGSDALRLYLLSSPIVSAENLNFSERELTESTRNLFRMLWNSYSFFTTYASIDGWKPKEHREPSADILDRWILSELQVLIRDIDTAMEAYDLQKASRLFMPFVDDLSNWYIRRNRKRFWKNENDGDKDDAYATLYEVLVTLSKLMAPFTPFIAEEIYRNLTDGESVHLAAWPEAEEGQIDEKLNLLMGQVREIVSIGLQKRAEAKVKVRQPLSSVNIGNTSLPKDLLEIIKEELNVKMVYEANVSDSDSSMQNADASGSQSFQLDDAVASSSMPNISLNTEITPQLALEGEAREIIRAIQEGRKKAGFEVSDRITLGIVGKEKVFDGDTEQGLSGFGEEIARETLATEVVRGDIADADYRDSTDIEGEPFAFSLKRNSQ